MSYFIKTTNGERGPLSLENLKRLVVDGKLKPNHQIRTETSNIFQSASQFKELFGDPEVTSSSEFAKDLGAGAMRAAGGVMSAVGGLLPSRRAVEATAEVVETTTVPQSLRGFCREGQDPGVVAKFANRAMELMTGNETIRYVAVQQKPVVNLFPDGIVLTNRRVMLLRPKVLGRLDMQDFIWREMKDVQIKEDMIGSTITFVTTSGLKVSMDYLPKAQARQLYRTAQEEEERVVEERRLRSMEEARAGANSVFVQTASPQGAGGDALAKLQQLKAMLDAGLITPEEFSQKKSELLAQM